MQCQIALIQPYFDYCSPLWRVCKTLKDKLQKFQKQAAKIIARVSFDTRSADVLCPLSWNELKVRRRISKSLLIFKILNDYTGPNLKESLIRRNIWQTNYDLRDSQTDLALLGSFSKKVLIMAGQNCGAVFHQMPNYSKFCPLIYKYHTGHTRLMFIVIGRYFVNNYMLRRSLRKPAFADGAGFIK